MLPYCCFAILCGLPLFLLESVIGQCTQEGPITCWTKLCPMAQGDFFVSFDLIIAGTISGISELQTVFTYLFLKDLKTISGSVWGLNDQLRQRSGKQISVTHSFLYISTFKSIKQPNHISSELTYCQ